MKYWIILLTLFIGVLSFSGCRERVGVFVEYELSYSVIDASTIKYIVNWTAEETGDNCAVSGVTSSAELEFASETLSVPLMIGSLEAGASKSGSTSTESTLSISDLKNFSRGKTDFEPVCGKVIPGLFAIPEGDTLLPEG